LVGTGAGARCVCDRNEDETRFGENPRTMLCALRSSALVSDPTVWVVLRSLSGLLRGAVDAEESEDLMGACAVGDAGRGVMLVEGIADGTASTIMGDRGSMSCFSCIEETIFAIRNDEMCFSVPRLVAIVGLDLGACDNLFSISFGAVEKVDCTWSCQPSSDFSEAKDSALADSSGTSFFLGRGGVVNVGEVVNCGWDGQQSVSRFHILQLRFSSRRPSSMKGAFLAKTTRAKLAMRCRTSWRKTVPL